MKAFFTLFFLSLSFLLASKSINAQGIVSKGVVFEKGTDIRIALAVVTNMRTNQGVGTNDMGFFQIAAQIGDTLLVQKRKFDNQLIIVKSDKDFVVNLIRADMLLNDITIKAENKQESLLAVKLEHRKKTYFYGKNRSPLHYIRYPIAAIMELFSAERKRARRFDRYYDRELKEQEVDRFLILAWLKEIRA
ncbi:hypothetical protein OC25_22605 [Pedobacter kyungheensis]|uniref:Carboxypeptidase-like regulatory domain-containing protein n=1 Tax=Pedobacter kyungheensis TaxID=1069985 RepID=A0A0C1FHK1_9SPHI|nr:hypothetical protein [Pedobacter kyungheensis]KIA91258.1 hypothetical protein OC25_22605 [Pedobacter kyungheensis]